MHHDLWLPLAQSQGRVVTGAAVGAQGQVRKHPELTGLPQTICCDYALYSQLFSNFGFIGVKRQAAVNLRISTKNTCFQALGIEALRIKLDHATGFVQDGHARHDLHIVVLQSQAAL